MPASSSSVQGRHGSSSSSLLGGTGGGLVAGSAGRQMARLGVTTDYTDLSLHSACANGNIGLVQYALQNGQPVNSVLNGVLPLHAAASSGNETIVRMLIEHGADVNSPRNERSKASGLAVGTAGSTPLHFAAANGHANIIALLLSFGAQPSATEKYGLTPEFIARQKGHTEAAEVLRRWQEEAADRDGTSSSATSIRSVGKKRIHPQRSFDALAVKLQQHASHPHLPTGLQMSSSSSSVNTIHSIHPANASGASVHRRLSVPGHVKDSLSTRRPSLPSVFEKAAHPSSTLKQALGLKGSRGSDVSSLRKGSSKTNLGSTLWSRGRSGSLLGEDEEAIGEEDEEAEEVTHRRKSEEVYRPTRPGSISSLISLEQPTTAPATKTSFHTSEFAPSPSITPRPPPPFHSSSSSASLAQTFYRPRQSSQLSGRPSLSPQPNDAASTSGARVFVDDDEEEEGGGAKEQRPLPASPRSASLRSPFDHVHRRRSTNSSYSIASSSAPSTSHKSSSGLATPEMESARASADNSDGSGASRSTTGRAPRRPAEPRLGFVIRDRIDSGNAGASSAARRAGLAAAGVNVAPRLDAASLMQSRAGDRTVPRTTGVDNLKKVETRTSRSNSAGTDGRFSSSPASSYSGPGAFSTYAPSNSTAATSVYPASPSIPHPPRQQPLTPLFETASSSHHLHGKNVTTSAQAHSRVKEAEQELLNYNPSVSSSGGATNRPTLSQQLAAYGRSLAVERKLAAMEGKGKSDYSFQTIGTSGLKPVDPPEAVKPPKLATTAQPLERPSSSKLAVPQWRAIPSTDRLMPPPASSGRRSVSPSSQHKGKEAQAPTITYAPVSTPSMAPASSAGSILSSPPRAGASTPSSTSSVTHVAAAPHVLGANPALTPKAAVSYVEVTPPSSSHPGSGTRQPHTHTHGAAPSKRSDRAHSNKGASSVTSAKDQLELDAIEQARIAAAVPTAVITANKKKGGFARRLFGSKN